MEQEKKKVDWKELRARYPKNYGDAFYRKKGWKVLRLWVDPDVKAALAAAAKARGESNTEFIRRAIAERVGLNGRHERSSSGTRPNGHP